MNELSSAKAAPTSSSSLVVAERKPQHKPGGCVGIFFKLFDWNRRFAKKKLFPKKLLPPVRATQVSKKFNADEKLPTARHLLIADAKTMGVSTSMKKNASFQVDSEQKGEEMKTTPSVVARLMGLETMPVLHPPPRPCKGSSSSENGKFGDGPKCASKKEEDLQLDINGNYNTSRHEFQPLKIQKTGMCDRRPLNRLGAVEAFQIRNVLSRSRKRQPKLASPVKSPKTARNTSRLMDAAARILEPGLQQARNRAAKCALTYPNSMMDQPLEDEVMREADMVVVDLPAPDSCRDVGTSQGHTSCRNCGHSLVAMDLFTSDVINPAPPVFDSPTTSKRPNSSSQKACGNQHDRMISLYPEKETEVVLLRSGRLYPPVRRELSSYPHNEIIRDSIPVPPNIPNHWTLPVDNNSSSTIRQREAASSSSGLDHRASLSNSRVPLRDDRVSGPVLANSRCSSSSRQRVSSNNNRNATGKYYISLNRNVGSQSSSGVRTLRKTDVIFEGQTRDHPVARDESSFPQRNLVRKRNAPGSRRLDSSVSSSPSMDGQRSIKSRVTSGANGPRFGNSSARPNHVVKGRLGSHGGERVNSALKSKARAFSSEGTKGIRGGRSMESVSDDGVSTLNLTNKESYGKEKSSTNSLLMDGDALSILLQQKLKELTSQAENESANGIAVPQGRTTATILQELISALTADQRQICNAGTGASSEDKYCQGEARPRRSSLRLSGDHFSPGSVLDGSFSNDSCVSSSIDDSPGHNMLQSESMDLSYDDPHDSSMNDDADISDSASSITNRGPSPTCNHNNNTITLVVADWVDHISSALQRFFTTNYYNSKSATCLSGYHAMEILLNMELIFGGVSHSERLVDFLLGSFLNQVEILAVKAWRNSVILGFDEKGESSSSSLRNFLFDCLVECLDIRYGKYSNSGFRTWRKISEWRNVDGLVTVFDEEVRKWACLAGRGPDEIIEWEMSHSVGKWTCFESEEFEAGVEIGHEIGHEIVQGLVDEIVADLVIM